MTLVYSHSSEANSLVLALRIYFWSYRSLFPVAKTGEAVLVYLIQNDTMGFNTQFSGRHFAAVSQGNRRPSMAWQTILNRYAEDRIDFDHAVNFLGHEDPYTLGKVLEKWPIEPWTKPNASLSTTSTLEEILAAVPVIIFSGTQHPKYGYAWAQFQVAVNGELVNRSREICTRCPIRFGEYVENGDRVRFGVQGDDVFKFALADISHSLFGNKRHLMGAEPYDEGHYPILID